MRYYFDINDGTGLERDHEGQDLGSLDEAKRAAVQELVLIFRDELPDGQRASFVVSVRDAQGKPVYVATAQVLGEELL
ncbi:DUF6894 family protein [Roseivivax sp. CAU 1761]